MVTSAVVTRGSIGAGGSNRTISSTNTLIWSGSSRSVVAQLRIAGEFQQGRGHRRGDGVQPGQHEQEAQPDRLGVVEGVIAGEHLGQDVRSGIGPSLVDRLGEVGEQFHCGSQVDALERR